jgi:DNA-binding response OmpR family regulator
MPTNEKRILIVDDDDAIRGLLCTVLSRRGFPVDTARNGLEALVRLRNCAYAAMLLDLMMPLKSGYDVLEELKATETERRPIVFVLTAGTSVRDLDPEVVVGTIRKPFDLEVLTDIVTACVMAFTARPQPPDCPPAESVVARAKPS